MNEKAASHTPPEAAMLLLRDYCQRREHLRIFDDFENAMAATRASFDKSLDQTKEPLKTVAQRLFKISKDAFFLIQVCEWKITYVAEALLHAIETRNPLSLANNTRALIEHVAALVFVLDALGTLRNSLTGQGSLTKITDAIARIESVLQRAYYGTSPKGKDKSIAAPHIESECLAAFEKKVRDIREVYDFLSEYVHPNYGSNLLVSTGQLGKGRLNPPPEFHKDTIDRICRYCSLTMLFLRDQALSILANLLHLKDFVDRCFNKGAKISNVFSKKKALPVGDGRSKETAFFFPKARTHGEAIEMTYRYLEESGANPTGIQYIGAMEEEYIFDVFPTSQGNLWFKIRRDEGG